MKDITKLADEWRNLDPQFRMLSDAYYCAQILEAALPVWTRITEDEATWQPSGVYVMTWYSCWECARTYRRNSFGKPIVGGYWRQLCDLDYPPEQES
jgi:hypothetical protein